MDWEMTQQIDLVFLPGMMCDARLFRPQLDAFPNSIVVMSHLHETITGMAHEVLERAPASFALAGLSMGGIVAMEVLRLAPSRVTKLALLDTNHRAELQAVHAKRLPQMQAVAAGNLETVMRDDMLSRYLATGTARPDILDLCMDMALSLGSSVFINQSQALMDRTDQTETLKTVTCPTLVLCGEDDSLCPVATHETMAELISHATLEVIAEAGHLATLEKPTETNAALTRWLEVS